MVQYSPAIEGEPLTPNGAPLQSFGAALLPHPFGTMINGMVPE
jgi:hypothetical protein